MRISYDYYNIFYYVARYQSISKAAKVLNNSQPNITRIINKLEDSLNCKLFIRTNKGVLLTGQGQALYYYAKAAHKQMELGEATVYSINNTEGRNVYIGISTDIVNNIVKELVLPAISSFHQDHPDIHLQITTKSTPTLISDTHNGMLDMAIITSSDSEINDSTKETVLYSFKDVIIAGNAYKKEFSKPITLEELCRHPIVGLGKHTETYQIYDHFFAEQGLEFFLNIETSTTEQTLSFVTDNLGIGCVASNYAYPAIEEGKIIEVKLKEELPERSIFLLRNEQSANPTATVMEEYIIEHTSNYKADNTFLQ